MIAYNVVVFDVGYSNNFQWVCFIYNGNYYGDDNGNHCLLLQLVIFLLARFQIAISLG